MKYTIDRIEGDYAVVELEDRTTANVSISALPHGAKVGDVIVVSIDKAETESRKARIEDKMERLFKR